MKLYEFCKFNVGKSKLPTKRILQGQCVTHLVTYCNACPFNWDHDKEQPAADDVLIKVLKLEPV